MSENVNEKRITKRLDIMLTILFWVGLGFIGLGSETINFVIFDSGLVMVFAACFLKFIALRKSKALQEKKDSQSSTDE